MLCRRYLSYLLPGWLKSKLEGAVIRSIPPNRQGLEASVVEDVKLLRKCELSLSCLHPASSHIRTTASTDASGTPRRTLSVAKGYAQRTRRLWSVNVYQLSSAFPATCT